MEQILEGLGAGGRQWLGRRAQGLRSAGELAVVGGSVADQPPITTEGRSCTVQRRDGRPDACHPARQEQLISGLQHPPLKGACNCSQGVFCGEMMGRIYS